MKYLIATIILFFGLSLNAQQIEKQVIANTGSDASVGGIQISQTVGEVAVQTYISGSFILGEGFQQVEKVIDDTTAIHDLDVQVNYNLYPNPTVDNVNIDLEILNTSTTLQIEIYNSLGQKTAAQKATVKQGGKTTVQFNLIDQSNGVYFMNFYNEEGKLISNIEFLKK